MIQTHPSAASVGRSLDSQTAPLGGQAAPPFLTFPLAGLVAIIACAGPASAQSPPDTVWRYTLLPESRLIDDCDNCGRPTLSLPLRGTFDLRLLQENPLFAQYTVTNVSWFAGGDGQNAYKVTGHGRFELGGEVVLMQRMTLDLRVDNGFTNRSGAFTNDHPGVERLWPMIKTHLDETNGSPVQFYRLELVAAPLREIWFSTAHGFTPGVPLPDDKHVSGGDLVSTAGRVVKRHHELSASLGIMPVVPDLGLDAVDVLPRGETAFSIEQDIFSESLGPLHHGDVLSDRGRIVANYETLVGAFSPEPPVADQGLDALQILEGGEIYFSVENDFFSESLGRLVRKGDLLSSRGAIVKSNAELIARFSPADPKQDYGLDALHVWPSGEVWFSVENGFYGSHFEPYNRGDLLSDQGYVVYRNLDLLAPFQPLEDLADFGLDALFIVSDLGAPPSTIPAPRCAGIAPDRSSGNIRLEWNAPGRVFQMERATNLAGPWEPASPILTEPPAMDPGAMTNAPQGFYRLRQW